MFRSLVSAGRWPASACWEGFILNALATLTLIYPLLVAAAVLGQRRLMYFPERKRTLPSEIGLTNIEEVMLDAPDGARIVCWWARAAADEPTLLYFHGNGGSLRFRTDRISAYQARGRGVFMMSYRGYSGSTGAPSERANVADGLLAYDRFVSLGVRPADLIVSGESLGSGVAVQVAGQRRIAGVVLDAPYTSTVEVGAKAYPYLPVRWLMLDRYESIRHIKSVAAPILIVHGERDRIIPVEMGRQLAAAMPGQAEIVTFPLAGHIDHSTYGSFEVVNMWIDRIRAGQTAAEQTEVATETHAKAPPEEFQQGSR